MTRVLSFNLLMLLLGFAAGCSGLPQPPGVIQPETDSPEVGAVLVKRLLTETAQVPLTNERRSLRSVYELKPNDRELRFIRARLNELKKAEIDTTLNSTPNPKDLEEDTILLIRSGQFWYFPRVWLATDEIGEIALVNGDAVLGLPFSRIAAFEKERNAPDTTRLTLSGPEVKPEGLGIQELADPRQKKFSFLNRDSKLKKLASSDAEVAIVSRQIRGQLHHLVIPLSNLSNDWRVTSTNTILGQESHFRNDDSLIFARLVDLGLILPGVRALNR